MSHDASARAVIDGESSWAVVEGEALALLASLPDQSIDAVITDPPYSSGGMVRGDRMGSTDNKYTGTEHRGVRPDFVGDNRDQRGWAYWCALWMSECLRVAKPGAPIVVFSDWRQLPMCTDAIQAGGWVWRGVAVWDKTEGSRPTLGRFRAQCEYLVWGSAGPMPLREDVGVLPGAFRHFVAQDDKHHQTGKPTVLMQQVVRICPRGGAILDPFAGSGTTGVAALLEGRRAILCERVAEYAEIARSRCAAAVGGTDWQRPEQPALFPPSASGEAEGAA